MIQIQDNTVASLAMTESLWLNQYDEKVPHHIYPDTYSSLKELFQEAFIKHSEKICYSNFGKNLTYAQVEKLTVAFASFLQNTCLLKKGDRVAIMLPNILQYPVAMLGTLMAGLVVVNVNPQYTARELKHILNDSSAKCIIALENSGRVLEEVLPKTRIEKIILSQIGDLLGIFKGNFLNIYLKHIKKLIPDWDIPDAYCFKEAINKKNIECFKPPELKGYDIAFLQYTGGTTGRMMGAVLTHRNIVANILQSCAWIEPLCLEKTPGGIVTALPLYHIFSLMANCLVFFNKGICNILISDPRDIKQFVKELKRQPFCFMSGVNTLFNALMNNEVFCQLDFSHFKYALGGGIAVQEAIAKKWQAITKAPLLQAYGLTEASPAVCISPSYMQAFTDTVGLPLPSTQIKICDEDGVLLPIGTAGELYVRGPQVMHGYWNQPKLTNEVITKDGWLKTGDIALINSEGFVKIVDRKKDLINVSGFKVYPNEIEEVISSMREIREVAVVGIQNEKNQETVVAFIVKKDPNLSKEEILTHCHNELVDYKVPKQVVFQEELPKSSVGKVLRRVLKDNKKALL